MSAILWTGTTATHLVWNCESTAASAINDVGQVAGSSGFFFSPDMGRATVWNGTTPTLLANPGGGFSRASAINNAGQVAGQASLPSGSRTPHSGLALA